MNIFPKHLFFREQKVSASSEQSCNLTDAIGNTQEEVLDYLKNIPSGITFVHGKAGCGKTYVINKLLKMVGGCQVLTPTNLAASLYHGARTIHSFFYGVLDDLDEGYQNPQNLTEMKVDSAGNRLRSIRLLIIDEISMVRADLFEMMNCICQKSRGNDKPFGGIPIVLVGDMFQLPPIVSEDAVLEYLKREYGGIYFFNSHVIRKEMNNIRLFELTKSYRQANDPSFVEILDAFRRPLSPEDKVKIMNAINSRVTDCLPSDAVYVASSNEEVRQVNTQKLSELPGEKTTIDAEYTIQTKDRNGHITIKHSDLLSDKDICEIVVPSAYDAQLSFKRGARVVLCKNSRPWGYINGDFGIIEDFNGDYFTIRLDKNGATILCPNPNDRYRSNQMNEYRYEMEYDQSRHQLKRKTPFIQKTRQFPVKLAYAFTIHKAQGQTYEKVIIDLNSHIFAPGQLYVALSRSKSMSGLFLTRPMTYSDIISDDSIFEFLYKLRMNNGVYTFSTKHKAVANASCAQFVHFIKGNESNFSSMEYMIHSLHSFNELTSMQEYQKASWELRKVIDLINSSYQLVSCLQVPPSIKGENITVEDCQEALLNIFNSYKKIVKGPHKQYQSDNRILITSL